LRAIADTKLKINISILLVPQTGDKDAYNLPGERAGMMAMLGAEVDDLLVHVGDTKRQLQQAVHSGLTQ
jgi:hypothetical protein